ncbi:uncharacterized protein LOC125943329 [Dermacentor silvarum]|uniref:uncharacterized protein LOC125943329 n=1 Tax=Dermacentor silvarum TaxID=543639 RepID=UPI002100C7DC|nr:uncharacterized protein LOC125943329 [Dermacentor silvarum]
MADLEIWLVAVVTPILKSRKPATALSSYRPVSLTSAACKAMERVALARLEWIASQLQYFPEQQTGFRRQRCTADSISDVVATLEDAKATGDVAMLMLLDVKSAFDGLPHAVIEACLDRLGLSGCLRSFISAFLTGRTFRVRVGQELSEPRDISTGVPQGSEVHAMHSVLATTGLDAVTAFLGSIGLTICTAKTEAMLIHPLASARRYTKQLKIAGRALPWQQMFTYLGLAIDHRLAWIPADKAATTKVLRVQGAVSKLQQHGQVLPSSMSPTIVVKMMPCTVQVIHGAA